MSKTPEDMAEEWSNNRCPEQGPEFIVWCMCKEDFLAGYKAAKAIVEEELQAVQAQRAEYPGLGAAQYALKSVLAKMGSSK